MKLARWLQENRGFLVFLLCFGFFRTAMADWNPVPSGSMRPTILEGDVVLVNRLAYDAKIPLTDVSVARLGEPRRGDIVTFRSPKNGERLIKRIAAIPGDVVAMHDDVLYVNGEAANYTELSPVTEDAGNGDTVPAMRATETIGGNRHRVQFLPALAAKRDFGPVKVPADQYFMLGDNRDNSEDSRYIGFVARQALIGRANHIMVSADILGHWLPRFDRIASRLE